MTLISLTDAFLHVANRDYTTDVNTANLGTEVAQLDATTFNSGGWNELAGGLKTVNLAYSGFWDSSADSRAYSDLDAGTARACTLGPIETEGSPAYMFQARNSQYTLGGQVGELAPFSVTANGSSGVGVVRGQLAKSKGTVAATGALGSGVELGALSSTQSLYATFHVFTTGTTITIDIERDSVANFASPATVATIGPLTSTGSTWVTPIVGPITDTYFRFNVTAITGSFTVAGAIGIA